MDDKHLIDPEQLSARSDGQNFPPPAEPNEKRFAADAPLLGRDNRGRRAGVTKAGEVVGSGAGAGGGGGPEDFDSDEASGGGKLNLPVDHGEGAGAENSNT
jgi:hypothetical protein